MADGEAYAVSCTSPARELFFRLVWDDFPSIAGPAMHLIDGCFVGVDDTPDTHLLLACVSQPFLLRAVPSADRAVKR